MVGGQLELGVILVVFYVLGNSMIQCCPTHVFSIR